MDNMPLTIRVCDRVRVESGLGAQDLGEVEEYMSLEAEKECWG